MSESIELVGLAEVAVKLRVPYQQVHRWLMVGRLNGTKIAGRWLVPRSELERLSNDLEQGA